MCEPFPPRLTNPMCSASRHISRNRTPAGLFRAFSRSFCRCVIPRNDTINGIRRTEHFGLCVAVSRELVRRGESTHEPCPKAFLLGVPQGSAVRLGEGAADWAGLGADACLSTRITRYPSRAVNVAGLPYVALFSPPDLLMQGTPAVEYLSAASGTPYLSAPFSIFQIMSGGSRPARVRASLPSLRRPPRRLPRPSLAALPRSPLGGGLEFSSPRLHQAQNETADYPSLDVGLGVSVLGGGGGSRTPVRRFFTPGCYVRFRSFGSRRRGPRPAGFPSDHPGLTFAFRPPGRERGAIP